MCRIPLPAPRDHTTVVLALHRHLVLQVHVVCFCIINLKEKNCRKGSKLRPPSVAIQLNYRRNWEKETVRGRKWRPPSMTSGVPREGGLGCSNPAPEIVKALQNRAKLNPIVKTFKIAEFRTPTYQDARKKGSKILKLPRFAIVLH